MDRRFKIVKIVGEKYPEGYVAYPLGLQGAVVGEGTVTKMRWPT